MKPADVAREVIRLSGETMSLEHTCDSGPGCARCSKQAEIHRFIRDNSPRGERPTLTCRCADGYVTESGEIFPLNPGKHKVVPCPVCRPEAHARWAATV